jgi:hypothetical protein
MTRWVYVSTYGNGLSSIASYPSRKTALRAVLLEYYGDYESLEQALRGLYPLRLGKQIPLPNGRKIRIFPAPRSPYPTARPRIRAKVLKIQELFQDKFGKLDRHTRLAYPAIFRP